MSETATEPTAPEGNQPTAGSSAEGSGGGVPAGFVPQAVADQAEARRRATQSALDQEKAKTAALEGRVGQIEEMMGRFDPAKVADEFTARFNQQQAIAAAKSQARDEFKLARADVFEATYQTPEELIQAAKSSHEAEEQYRASVRSEVETDVFSKLKETHGLDLAPAPQTQPAEGEGGGKAALTQADLASMPMSEYLKLDQAVIDAVPVA